MITVNGSTFWCRLIFHFTVYAKSIGLPTLRVYVSFSFVGIAPSMTY